MEAQAPSVVDLCLKVNLRCMPLKPDVGMSIWWNGGMVGLKRRRGMVEWWD